jgi:hypothetical protein
VVWRGTLSKIRAPINGKFVPIFARDYRFFISYQEVTGQRLVLLFTDHEAEAANGMKELLREMIVDFLAETGGVNVDHVVLRRVPGGLRFLWSRLSPGVRSHSPIMAAATCHFYVALASDRLH